MNKYEQQLDAVRAIEESLKEHRVDWHEVMIQQLEKEVSKCLKLT